jgi:hypothetical protein
LKPWIATAPIRHTRYGAVRPLTVPAPDSGLFRPQKIRMQLEQQDFRLERQLMPPEQRSDGSWRWPVQVTVMHTGKYSGFGIARWELVGYTSDLAHREKLQGFLK